MELMSLSLLVERQPRGSGVLHSNNSWCKGPMVRKVASIYDSGVPETECGWPGGCRRWGVNQVMQRGQYATMECRGRHAGEISIELTGVEE